MVTFDVVLLILAFVLLLAGLAGAFIPILPGPPLSMAGLLLVHITRFATIDTGILYTMATLTLIITVVDYLLPVWGTKWGKGTKHGIMGATLGLIIGIFFFPPVGVVVGPLAGAWLAEKVNGADNPQAFRSALGSFLGLLLGALLKFAVSVAMIWYALSGIILT